MFQESSSKPHSQSEEAFRTLLQIQGAYFAVTGIWPLVHMPSFEALTGPKADRWLVRTVGGLVGVIGAALVSAGRSGRWSPEIRGIAAGSAATLAAIDITYVARRRIPPVYLLDAVAEIGLLAGWAWSESTLRARSASEKRDPPFPARELPAQEVVEPAPRPEVP